MVRRTKEESLATRHAIIAAAREVFYHNGVTNTSLDQIAKAAGVTRGAIYWHFADKVELFYAMRDEVKIPLVDRSDIALAEGDGDLDALQRIERFLGVMLDQLSQCAVTCRTFEIMTFKCEYVGEFARDLEGTALMHAELRDKLATLYREAKRRGMLRPGVTALCAASDTLVFLAGMIKVWVVDQDGTLVRNDARRLVRDHVDSKRAAPREADAPGRRRVSRA